jgi:hypothetical protein
MSIAKRQPNQQDQDNQQQHHQLLQQQKTRQQHGPKKPKRNVAALDQVSEYHDHERIETRLTR